jgi:hypothetical protein
MGGAASADEFDLTGGVLICHAPPGLVYTVDAQDQCGIFSMVDCCLDQVNQMDCSSTAPYIWYIVSQFFESKTFGQIEIGISYDPAAYIAIASGICWPPTGGLVTEYPSEGAWPSDGSAIAAAVSADEWSGDCVATHWIAGYAYCEPYGPGIGIINLVPSPQTSFIGWGSMSGLFAPACIGALGIGQPGVYCCSEPPPMYACCLPDGSCVDVFRVEECDALGGIMYPDVCALTDCPQPPEPFACCLPDGSCVDVLAVGECDALGGIAYPDVCAQTDCPQPQLFACCLPDGSCVDVMDVGACDALGGILYPDVCALTDCPQPPEPFACCLEDGSCVDVIAVGECDALGGVAYPEVCALTDCPQPPAEFACCFELDEACYMMTEADCLAGGGTWNDGMVCSTAGGTFDCPMWRVCCEAEVCTITTEAECMGVWHMDWLSCDPNPCEVTPSDDPSWGTIKAMYR